MADNWQQAMVQEVYYPMGRYNHDHGKKRFVRAPFALVKFQPVTDAAWEDFWMPCGAGGSEHDDGYMRGYLDSDGGDYECRHPFGCITKQDIIMNQSELGNTSPVEMGEPEKNDTWKMFHRIGFI